MTKFLTKIGFGITAAYCLVLFFLIKGRFDQIYEMPLNELGDFSAGIFGPIAFFWLILGFLQQGQELKQTTKALELQAKELNNSVSQQKELVGISRQQLEAEIEALSHQRKKEAEQALPNFHFPGVGGQHARDIHKFHSNVKNTGSPVSNVVILIDIMLEHISPAKVPYWDLNQELRIDWEFKNSIFPDESIMSINFTDRLGNHGVKQYKLIGSIDSNSYKVKAQPMEANHIIKRTENVGVFLE